MPQRTGVAANCREQYRLCYHLNNSRAGVKLNSTYPCQIRAAATIDSSFDATSGVRGGKYQLSIQKLRAAAALTHELGVLLRLFTHAALKQGYRLELP